METALERFEMENFNHHLIPEGYLFLARLSFEMEDYDKSVRYLAVVRSLVEGSPSHNFRMGIIYQGMEKHREALEVFQQVSGKNYSPNLFPTQPLPNPSELSLHMAYSFYCIKDRRKALELINASAPQASQAGKSWEWMGTKAFLFNNMKFAAIAFETALRFGALEPASWERLAAIYRLQGFSQKAEQCLAHATGRV